MKETIKEMWEKRPLVLILFLGGLFRMLAVIFSKGYGMHDDHFLVIEPAQAWIDGYSYTHNWLPNADAPRPDGYTLLYPGLNYIALLIFKIIGLNDPQSKMYVLRFFNAMWSMLVIVYGYKITNQLAGMKVARQAGMILALLFFMPMFAVRSLVEVVTMPSMLIATWLLIDPARKEKLKTYAWVGFWCGIAFNTRFQSALFVAGMGLVILFSKNWKGLIAFGLGGIATVLAVQLVADQLIWHHPFAELSAYIKYNVEHATEVINGEWYNYLLLIGGLLIPPISLFIMFGFGRSWKKYPVLFWPAFLFFAFHSIFPNKQERFILPVVPLIIVLGLIGWSEFYAKSKFWQGRPKLMHYCWVFFWTLDLIALPVISVTYSKRTRVESMTYLAQQKDMANFMIDESNDESAVQSPLFYLGRWDVYIPQVTKTDNLAKEYYVNAVDLPKAEYPNYIVFYGKKNLEQRLADFEKVYPETTYETTIYPSFIDRLMEFLNPINKNETAFIYKFGHVKVNPPYHFAAALNGAKIGKTSSLAVRNLPWVY